MGCLPSSQNRFSFTSCLTFLYAVCFRKTNRLLFFIYDFNKIGFDSNEQVCVCVCVSEHLCVCIPIQIYIIYTIFVLPFKIKRCFLIKCQSLAIKKKFPGTASCQCPCPCGELVYSHLPSSPIIPLSSFWTHCFRPTSCVFLSPVSVPGAGPDHTCPWRPAGHKPS